MITFLKERWNTLRGLADTNFSHVYVNTMGSMCTNRCFMCPARSLEKKIPKMPNEVFLRIIHELKDIDFSGELHLYGQNEALLDTKIFDRINYAHEQLPNAKLAIISNFTAIGKGDKLLQLVNAPLSYLSCSIYALDQSRYKAICGMDNFRVSIINQIKFLKEYAKNPKYSFAIYLMENEHNIDDIDFCKHFVLQYLPAKHVNVYKIFSLFNTKHTAPIHNKGYINSCIYKSLYFTGSGDISICSVDSCGQLNIGKLEEKNKIKDLVNNDKAIELRKRMHENKQQDAYCRYCHFGKSENKILYYLPLPKAVKKIITNKVLRSYRDEQELFFNSQEEIKNKLAKLNEIFRDNEENKWLDVIEQLRKKFYAEKQR